MRCGEEPARDRNGLAPQRAAPPKGGGGGGPDVGSFGTCLLGEQAFGARWIRGEADAWRGGNGGRDGARAIRRLRAIARSPFLARRSVRDFLSLWDAIDSID